MRTVASMATMKGRVCRHLAIRSLVPQVDELIVHYNGFSEAEMQRDLLELPPSVRGVRSEENLGDQMKFLCATGASAPWRCTCDDDLVYPPNYVRMMTHWASRMDGPVSVHGCRLRQPFTDYYRDRTSWHFARKQDGLMRADILGTGLLCWFDAWHRFTPEDFGAPNMADIWAAIAFRKQGRHLVVIPHGKDWVVDCNPPVSRELDRTIYAASCRRDGSFLDTGGRQTEVLREHAHLFDLKLS